VSTFAEARALPTGSVVFVAARAASAAALLRLWNAYVRLQAARAERLIANAREGHPVW